MTGPVTDAEREAEVRRRVRHRLKALRVKAALLGKPSPWDSPKMRAAFEDLAVAGGLGFPPEKLEDPKVVKFDFDYRRDNRRRR